MSDVAMLAATAQSDVAMLAATAQPINLVSTWRERGCPELSAWAEAAAAAQCAAAPMALEPPLRTFPMPTGAATSEKKRALDPPFPGLENKMLRSQ